MLMNRDTLLAILKGRFDYYSAQAVTNELLSALDMKDWTDFNDEALAQITSYLEDKVPGSEGLIARINAAAVPAAPAEKPAEEPAPEKPAEPAAEAKPEEPAEKPKKKAAKKKK
jgi:hypothetical protein